MTKENGGTAFPRSAGEFHGEQPGMSLRDYFAAKAMQSILSDAEKIRIAANALGLSNIADVTSHIAKDSYMIADAMLEARKQ